MYIYIFFFTNMCPYGVNFLFPRREPNEAAPLLGLAEIWSWNCNKSLQQSRFDISMGENEPLGLNLYFAMEKKDLEELVVVRDF